MGAATLVSLPLNLHRHYRLENHFKLALIDLDYVNQPLDHHFDIRHDDCLLPEENAHFGALLAQIIPACIFHLSFLLFIAMTLLGQSTVCIFSR